MKPRRDPPTDQALRAAFERSALATLGYTFDTAMAQPAIAASLAGMAASDRRWCEVNAGRGSRRLEYTTGK